MPNVYVAPGVSRSAIRDFLLWEKEYGRTEIHSFSVTKGGKLLCRIALPPYEIHDKKQLYSLSKSFCSLSVGFAVDEGLFSLDDRIVDLFPESVPENVSENLGKMKVRHLLSMSTGHRTCVMPFMKESADPARTFLSQEVVYTPGEKFVYNTGATHMLAIIVQKFTGRTAYDYLYEKLLRFFDDCPAKWDVTPAGFTEGGIGVYASIRDIENLGSFLMNDGVIDGKRLLSHEYIALANSKQVDNSDNGTPDWVSGYGFQFWMNSRGGCRADGAGGQLCMMMKERDTLFCVQCESADMQKEIDGLYDFLDKAEGEDTMTDDGFSAFLDSFYKPEKCKEEGDFSGFGRTFRTEKNESGICQIGFRKTEDGVEIRLVTENRVQSLFAGNGEYKESLLWLCGFKPALTGLIPKRFEEAKVSCAVSAMSENVLEFFVRHRSAPHSSTLRFEISGDTLTYTMSYKSGSGYIKDNRIIGKSID